MSLMTKRGLQEFVRSQSKFDPSTPLADRFEIMAELFLEQALNEITEMSSKDAMIAAGISIDKMRLLRGLPTEITVSLPILIKIASKAADENIPLSLVMTNLLEAMNES